MMDKQLHEYLDQFRPDEPSPELRVRILAACRPRPLRFSVGVVAATILLIMVNVSIERRFESLVRTPPSRRSALQIEIPGVDVSRVPLASTRQSPFPARRVGEATSWIELRRRYQEEGL